MFGPETFIIPLEVNSRIKNNRSVVFTPEQPEYGNPYGWNLRLETGFVTSIFDRTSRTRQLKSNYSRRVKGIIVFTNEYPEMMQVADRVLVMYKGRIVKDLPRSEMSEPLVMAYSTGSMR